MNKIKVFPFNPIETNTYVLHDQDTHSGVIIDPTCALDQEVEILKNYIEEQQIKIEHILLTHPHFDHLMGAHTLCSYYGLPLQMHEKAEALVAQSLDPAFTYGVKVKGLPAQIQLLKHKSVVCFGTHTIEVRYAPGHCEGSVIYVWAEEKTVFTGDVLFRDSIGRTDLPTGDLDVLRESIRSQIFSLDDDYTLRPGHGGRSTVEYERYHNPFL